MFFYYTVFIITLMINYGGNMSLPQPVIDKLEHWLKINTWYTDGAEDEKRFHFFVKALWNETKKIPDEGLLKKTMTRKANECCHIESKTQKKLINEYCSLTVKIISFLKNTE